MQINTFLSFVIFKNTFNSLHAELNPTCHLLALLGAHRILDVSRIRVKEVKIKCQKHLPQLKNKFAH